MTSPAQVNLFLITGDDPASIEAETAGIIARVAGPDPDPFALDVFREREDVGRAELLRQLVRSLLSPPFIGGRKTVWLKDFSGFDSDSAKSKDVEAVALRDLTERILTGIPADIVLVMNGPNVDERQPLALACAAKGQVIVCARPTLRNRDWRGTMRELIERRAAEQGARLGPGVVDHLVAALGTDTGRIPGEIEKLICYVGGPDQPISQADAALVCTGLGEEMPWALSNALGKRDAAEALRVIEVLLEGGRDDAQAARSLLGQAAKYYRELLQIKVFMAEYGVRAAGALPAAVQRLTPEEKQRCLTDGLPVMASNVYRCKALAGDAGNYSGADLVEAVRAIHDAYLKCISSGAPERLLLDEVLTRIATPPSAPPGRR